MRTPTHRTSVMAHWCACSSDPVSASKHVHSPIVVSMLGQRRRRFSSIDTTMGECIMFDMFAEWFVALCAVYFIMNLQVIVKNQVL